jgi:hypothetical protein
MKSEPDSTVEELKRRQRNIVFPDTVTNARSVDAFLLRGDPRAPLIQRMGAWVFGSFFVLCGVVCFNLALNSHAVADYIYCAAGFLIGIKLLISGFRSNTRRNRGD